MQGHPNERCYFFIARPYACILFERIPKGADDDVQAVDKSAVNVKQHRPKVRKG